jgi:hypothetical protein
MAIMQAKGYNVTLLARKNRIAWALGNNVAVIYTIFPDSLNFHAFHDEHTATLKDANEWNKVRKFSKAYLGKDNDLAFELDSIFQAGPPRPGSPII